MTTKRRHMERSHRSHKTPIFKSLDKASHYFDNYMRPVFKEHRKKYDGKGNRLYED